MTAGPGPVAILPVYNISGTPVETLRIAERLRGGLVARGWDVLPEAVVDGFINENRLRYIGGIDEGTASRMRERTGANSVMITSLLLFDEVPPPRIAISCRLVSTGRVPEILWMEGVGRAGDDDAGILAIGLIEDPGELIDKVVGHLLDSVTERWERPAEAGGVEGKNLRAYPPRAFYRSPILSPDKTYRVAVIPFYNSSERRFAGEILALQFLEEIRKARNLEPVEPGAIRHALLGLRVTMEDGISLANTDILFQRLDVDLIVTGRVLDYRDYHGTDGVPRVDFSTLVIERRSREVVWSSKSSNDGLDRVRVFDWGKENTAFRLASKMVENVVYLIVSGVS